MNKVLMHHFLLDSFYRDEAFCIQNVSEAVLLSQMMVGIFDPKIKKGLPTAEEEGLPS